MKSLLAVMVFVGLAGCQDPTLTGKVDIKFNDPGALTLNTKIYDIGNLDYPLISDVPIDASGRSTLDLNYGNYIIEYFRGYADGSNYATRQAFQVMPDKTTSVVITL
jgi:hypothetical protein